MKRSHLARATLAAAVATGLVAVAPLGAATAAPTDCPTAFPTTDAVDGVTGTGYTVEKGTTADPFSATILGRITDGIEPGVDMIMADLSSPALSRAGGVWAGMSGSPVYAADGRLIGSVSYGLAASSPIAGITPASDMMKLRTADASKDSIKVSSAQAKRIAKTGDVSAKAAASGFHRLALPVSVSGTGKLNKKWFRDLRRDKDVIVRTGGSRISAKASAPSEITAGSNFVAALSYGDVSLAATGTTTFVCNGQAVAFGHPFFDAGGVQFSAHPASAVLIQPDPIFGPFKVANPGGPVGVVNRDATEGIRADLGKAPTTAFPVTTSLKNGSAAPVTGTTTGVYQPWAADIAAYHLQTAIIKALGADGAGSAALTYTIKGETAAGSKFSLTRSDHYADSLEVSYIAASDLFNTMYPLVTQEFKDVKITGVDIKGTVSDSIDQYRVTSVKVRKNGQWVTQKGTLKVTSGKIIPTQITLAKYRSNQTLVVGLTAKVPAKTSGASGTLTISDGPDAAGLVSQPDPNSLTQLLKSLAAAPTYDSLVGTVALDTGSRTVTLQTAKRIPGTVSFYSKDINLLVK